MSSLTICTPPQKREGFSRQFTNHTCKMYNTEFSTSWYFIWEKAHHSRGQSQHGILAHAHIFSSFLQYTGRQRSPWLQGHLFTNTPFIHQGLPSTWGTSHRASGLMFCPGSFACHVTDGSLLKSTFQKPVGGSLAGCKHAFQILSFTTDGSPICLTALLVKRQQRPSL